MQNIKGTFKINPFMIVIVGILADKKVERLFVISAYLLLNHILEIHFDPTYGIFLGNIWPRLTK